MIQCLEYFEKNQELLKDLSIFCQMFLGILFGHFSHFFLSQSFWQKDSETAQKIFGDFPVCVWSCPSGCAQKHYRWYISYCR